MSPPEWNTPRDAKKLWCPYSSTLYGGASVNRLNDRGNAIGNYALFIGLRYSFSRKRNRFTSIISLVSMLGMVLGVASLVGIPGALAVTWLGDRYGYFLPIAGAATAQLAVMLWLLRAEGFTAYFVIACVYSIGWAFVLPYFQALCARIDPRGSVVVAGGFATGAAGFFGPAGAALLVRPGDYGLMIGGQEKLFNVQCVRGNSSYGQNHFVSRLESIENHWKD